MAAPTPILPAGSTILSSVNLYPNLLMNAYEFGATPPTNMFVVVTNNNALTTASILVQVVPNGIINAVPTYQEQFYLTSGLSMFLVNFANLVNSTIQIQSNVGNIETAVASNDTVILDNSLFYIVPNISEIIPLS
jgi:hypothetical protein